MKRKKMKKVLISNKVLPSDWINKIKNFDIDNSTLTNSLKPLCYKIKQNILAEGNNAVTSYFNRSFIRHVCLDEKWELDTYEDIPIELINEVFNELRSEKGIQYDTKLHSLFSELRAYKYLVSQGYRLFNSTRPKGACDLDLKKGAETYHCEVKLKKSEDNHIIGIIYFIKGKAFLPKYDSLRALDRVYYKLIKSPNSYSDVQKMYDEIDKFCSDPSNLYEGDYIHLSSKIEDILYQVSKRGVSDYIITQHTNESTESLMTKILTGQNRHLTKLIEKSSKFENFIGYLSLNIPFYDEIKKCDLEEAFNSLALEFKLYVEVNGAGIEEGYVLEIN